jgi:hypothetical protein
MPSEGIEKEYTYRAESICRDDPLQIALGDVQRFADARERDGRRRRVRAL